MPLKVFRMRLSIKSIEYIEYITHKNIHNTHTHRSTHTNTQKIFLNNKNEPEQEQLSLLQKHNNTKLHRK